MRKGEAQKVALVTGSTDGLGRAVALSLAACGFEVLIHGRDAQRGSDLVRQIRGQGGGAVLHRADFASLAAVRSLARAYSGMRAYAQSKLAQVMLTFDLAAELRDSGITVNCLHPATYMDTTMVRAAGVEPVSTVAEGAAAVMRLAVSEALAGHSGEYFDGLRPARANAQAYDPQARRRLAEVSARLAGLDGEP